jgi:hypothetical protein
MFLLQPGGMNDLTARVRERIRDGDLPSSDCLVTWLGAGRGEICVVCASRILGSEVSIECELPDRSSRRFHARCYELWRSVRRDGNSGPPARR